MTVEPITSGGGEGSNAGGIQEKTGQSSVRSADAAIIKQTYACSYIHRERNTCLLVTHIHTQTEIFLLISRSYKGVGAWAWLSVQL